ncbi:MAG: septal ring lytic transglycosylase RlpA family protein [Vampirovibrionales bacterium]
MIVRFSTATERIFETLHRSNSEPSCNSRKNAWFNPNSSEQSDTFTPSKSSQTNTWNNRGNSNSERGDWGGTSNNIAPPSKAPEPETDPPVSEADENPTEQVPTKTPVKPNSRNSQVASSSPTGGKPFQSGMASYYGGGKDGFNGKRMANGKIFNDKAMTCAHPSLPFGTALRVVYKGKSVTVTVTDRGPFSGGRVIDLSAGAAQAIGMKAAGVGKVDIYKV